MADLEALYAGLPLLSVSNCGSESHPVNLRRVRDALLRPCNNDSLLIGSIFVKVVIKGVDTVHNSEKIDIEDLLEV